MSKRPSQIVWKALALGVLGLSWTWCAAQEPEPQPPVPAERDPAAIEDRRAPAEGALAEELERPEPIPEVRLGPELPTHPIRRQAAGPSVITVDTSVLPLDREGIWVLDFAFKPVRMRTVEIPGKGRRQVFYMYYRVINRTGEPRMFVPQFTLVTSTGQRYEDTVLPQAVSVIQMREDPSIPLLGAVESTGIIPPSTREGVDDAVYGVAVWEEIDPRTKAFQVYVRGLSDGYQEITPPDSDEPVVRYKTLRIDFMRRGDERNWNERQIELLDPPYEWIYW